jgi:hypothetical protein
MNKIKRFLSFCCVWFFGIIFAGIFCCVFLAKPILTSMLELSWGVDLSIGKIGWDAQRSVLAFDDVRVGNPYGFPRGNVLEIKRVEAVLDDFFYEKKTVNFRSMDFFIDKVELMRRVSGHLNLELLVKPDSKSDKKGLQIAPFLTRFNIEAVSETDATGPLLQKKDISLPNREIIVGFEPSFHDVARVFVVELVKSIESVSVPPVLPAPEYKGLVSSIEESLQDQAKKISEENAGYIRDELSPAAVEIAS